ncbi:hypothetical protein acsn021_09510 [Anaerocolumna cellulosilytica]|uniref:Uncharacterized protein n=1 Tax=Anaerocolumna cellulosilytica TaxID=433286 RepID=A0A6S6R1G9_9FIRM|nr:glycosyltransferase [Anaerocolumna cellulosilytica]MBB5194437.1 glycosyltransferase involved in cell wall biosynthesis [Anaerocolumna cellulosilytica]BCJ93382.1 hypothetical protein acsn021_09510 [Anaerocolumna cellulosilytica]
MRLISKVRLLLVAYQRTEDKKKIISKVWKTLLKGGISGLKLTIFSVSTRQDKNVNDKMDIYEYQQKEEYPCLNANKNITVIIEVNDINTDITGTINSINSQIYNNYNIIIITPVNYKNVNDVINYSYINYPGEVYNKVIDNINGEYFIVINGSNILHPNALQQFAQKIENISNATVYCDECIFDGRDGKRTKYFIKPDYSPIYQLTSLYIEQGVMFSKEVVKKAGGFNNENICYSARINDTVLKALQYSEYVIHINQILLLRNSFAEEIDKYYNLTVIDNALMRLGHVGNALFNDNNYNYNFSLSYKNPKVSIIIPTDDLKLIHKCITSIISKTDYPIYEIIIVANKSVCEKLEKKYKDFSKLSYVLFHNSFNYAQKCNLGANEAKGDILLFMQDTVVISYNDWLKKIISCFAFEQVGAVSPKVIREDKTIRYAGIISGGFGFFPIPFNGEPNVLIEGVNEPAFFSREVSILSATCIAIRKDLYTRIQGFNEVDTPDKFSNADISFKVQNFGLKCMYCADSIIATENSSWYDSWFNTESKSAYIYLLKNYMYLLENDPYFTNEMKYYMLRNVPHEYSFYSSGKNKDKSGFSILLVSHELSLTGAPIALHYAAKTIRESGNYPVVVSPYDGKLRRELLSDGIDVIIDSTINGSDFWIKWATNFDLIIVSTLVQYHSIVQLKDMKIPVIWWVHESRESYLIGADRLIPNEVGQNIHIYCGGGYAKSVMKEFRPSYRTEELLYCVPDYASEGKKDYKYKLDNIKDKIVFSIIGTIEERKGQDIFSKAVMAMPKEYIEKCRFFIIGRKINDIIYDDVIKLKNMYPDQVTLINEVSRDEIRDVYDQCDVVVCASKDDPMPVFMTECLMLSKIAICSENTGTASLLQDGINGLVYKNNDYKELMNKMIYVIDNNQSLNKLKQEGRNTYEKYFTKEAFDNSITQIINQLLKEEN